MTTFETKDSGEREHFDSGMQRDTEEGKARFDLMVPEGVPYQDQLLTRFAELLARGAVKYNARNWEQATGDEEIARAKSSAFRHFFQWFTGETDEDHAAAVLFNLMVVETVQGKLRREAEANWAGRIMETLGAPVFVEIPMTDESLKMLDLVAGGIVSIPVSEDAERFIVEGERARYDETRCDKGEVLVTDGDGDGFTAFAAEPVVEGSNTLESLTHRACRCRTTEERAALEGIQRSFDGVSSGFDVGGIV